MRSEVSRMFVAQCTSSFLGESQTQGKLLSACPLSYRTWGGTPLSTFKSLRATTTVVSNLIMRWRLHTHTHINTSLKLKRDATTQGLDVHFKASRPYTWSAVKQHGDRGSNPGMDHPVVCPIDVGNIFRRRKTARECSSLLFT